MITELYAWIIDDPTGTHCIMGFMFPDGLPMQAVSSKKDLLEKPLFLSIAEETRKQTGYSVTLKRFVLEGK